MAARALLCSVESDQHSSLLVDGQRVALTLSTRLPISIAIAASWQSRHFDLNIGCTATRCEHTAPTQLFEVI